MVTLLAIYLSSAYTYTYMSVNKKEGETRLGALKRKHGDNWWKFFIVSSPLIYGKKILEESQPLKENIKSKIEAIKEKVGK